MEVDFLSYFTMAIIGVIVLLVLLIMGMNIGICMMAVGFFGVWYVKGNINTALSLFKNIPYTQATNYSFTVIPYFFLKRFSAASFQAEV